jgi:hypothetical protein
MEPVRGQDDRTRERHAMDGVWLPAGGENPGARGFPDSRHTLRPGIAKGEAFSPLARPRQRQVGKSRLPIGRNRTIPDPDPDPDPQSGHRTHGLGLMPRQSAYAQGPGLPRPPLAHPLRRQ